MPSKYEVAADETVPIARSIIAKELIEKYSLKETEVADYLGVAQAAISKYVTEKYSENLKGRIEEIEKKIESNRELIDDYIQKISEGKQEYVRVCICTICNIANDFSCSFSHAYSESIATSGMKV